MKLNAAITTTLSAVAVSTAMGISAAPAFSADFTLSNSSGTWSNVVGGSNIDLNVLVGSENQVRWGGTTGLKSGLGFTGVGLTEFNVDELFAIGTLRHFNNPTPLGTAPTATDLGINLNFTNPAGLSKTFNFTFGINETPNDPPPACPVGNPPCADIISFPRTLPSETFEFMGMDFTLELVKFALTPDGEVTNEFISPEGGTNTTMLFGKIIQVNPPTTPEPGVLGALGLFSVYFVARRRRSQDKV